MATALFLSNNQGQSASTPETGYSRVRVRLEKLKSKARKSLLKLLGQPRTCGKPTNEKCELLMINQERRSRMSEHTDRIGGKASPEVVPDTVHSGLNRGSKEGRNLRTVCENVSALLHQQSEYEFTQSTLSSQP